MLKKNFRILNKFLVYIILKLINFLLYRTNFKIIPSIDQLDKFADAIGLAYQIIDDVLDGTVSTDILGKDSGSDRNSDKSTYLSELGEQNAREFARDLHERAIRSLDCLSINTGLLRELAAFTIYRTH